MGETMNFSYKGDWNENYKRAATGWIREQLTILQSEPPEDLFLDYIIVMIGNEKSMTEIAHELKDFFGEDESRDFAKKLGEYLQSLTQPKKIVTLNSKKANDPILDSSLKSSRSGNNARLLQTAIRSSQANIPSPRSSEIATNEKISGNKRKIIIANANEMREEKTKESRSSVPIALRTGLPAKNPMANVAFPGMTMGIGGMGGMGAMMPGVGVEQMSNLARMYGFNSVEEMMLTQQSMMLSMMTASAPLFAAGGVVSPHALTSTHGQIKPVGGNQGIKGAEGSDQYGVHSGAGAADGPSSFRGRGRGRGAWGRGRGSAGADISGGGEWEWPSGGYEGRGRGRGSLPYRGRGGRAPNLHWSQGQAEVAVPPSDTAAGGDPAAVGFDAGATAGDDAGAVSADQEGAGPGPGMGGRGRFGVRGRGRGRFDAGRGSGQRAGGVEHKKWVRQADMSSALVTGR